MGAYRRHLKRSNRQRWPMRNAPSCLDVYNASDIDTFFIKNLQRTAQDMTLQTQNAVAEMWVMTVDLAVGKGKGEVKPAHAAQQERRRGG